MDFQKYLEASSQEVNEYLKQLFSEWKKRIENVTPQLVTLYDLFVRSTSGGKGIRGTLVKLGYELAGSLPHKEITKVAAAFEIVHTALLTHDDIIDKSPLRRGKPTLYKALGGDHYGISQSICLGDLGFFLAIRLVAESNFNEKVKSYALSTFCEIITNTIIGEMLDIELAHKDQRREERDVLTIHQLKTAQYTIVGPLVIGAILGGATEKLLKNIRLFGESLGIAFQIQDDILGVFGNPQVVGKSVTSDIEEGKNTLLVTYALTHASATQKHILDTYYGNGKISQKQHTRIKKVFQDLGALAYSQQKVLHYTREARNVIPHITQDINTRALLDSFMEFLIKRQK